MADSRDAIEEIRHRVNVLDVISEYVTLKHAGKSCKGLCPFHSEKTPSFTVREEFQTWHCFGCGEHGDVFTFLMKIENLTFAEALERLAKRAGVELERYQNQQTSQKERLGKINSLAAAYYTSLLKQTPSAIEYLRSRGLADQTIEQFKLGYAAPAWDGLVRHLTQRNVDLSEAANAGLIVQRERSEGYYDRFRNRIIFPILDIQERVIAFGGRGIGDDQPKYLNSPETPLFSKTRSLYGLNLARKAIADGERAVVVEGYMDVITVQQAGFANCVATLGTALTLDHINLLSRYTNKVVLAYDAESAGITAALRGAAMFGDTECDVRIARLPGGDDPDSLIRNGRISDFDAAITGALPIVDYKLTVLQEQHDISNPAERAAMLKEAVRILAEVPTNAERERHIKGLTRWHPNYESGTTRAEDHIRADVERLIHRRSSAGGDKPVVVNAPLTPKTALEKAEIAVLRALVQGEEGAEIIIESLVPEDFTNEISQNAAKQVFGMFAEKQGIYLPELLETADENISRFLSELAMREEGPPVSGQALQDFINLIKNFKLRKLRSSDIIAPYIKEGNIDTNSWSPEEYREFLRKSGKLKGIDNN